MTGCPTDEMLVNLVEGMVPQAFVAHLQDHLDACPTCLELVVELARGAEAPAELAPPSPAAPLPAEFAEFKLGRPLARGAGGQCFEARDQVLDRVVAIRLIDAHDLDTDTQSRFQDRTRRLSRLRHPNLVETYGAGEIAGRWYVVSELVRGRTFEELAAPIPPALRLTLALEATRGLAAAHGVGLTHGAIEPARIVLADDGSVKLGDFDLHLPGPGKVHSLRADVSALGGVLQGLCGAAASDLSMVLDRCVDPGSASSFASAAEMLVALEQIVAAATTVELSGPELATRPPSPTTATPRAATPWTIVIMGLVLTAVAALVWRWLR